MENKEIFDNNEFTAKTENTQPEAVQGATSPVQSQDYENIYSSAQTTTEAPAAAESVQSNSSEQTSAAAGVQQQPAMQTPVQPTIQQPAAPQQSTTPQQSYNTPPYAVQNRFTNGNQYQQMPQHYDTNGNPITIGVYEPKKKKSHTGAKVALGIGAVAMIAVLGVGCGFIGTKIAGGFNESGNIQTSLSSSSSSEDDERSSALKITQASETDLKPTSIQEVVAKVKDSVVEITTETTQYDSFYGQYVSQAAGSGVIITEDGYILTNNHVIENASSVTVRLTNGKDYEAKVIGYDATLDVALIKIDETGLTTSTFGDSSKLSVGQDAIAIGNPLGKLGGTVTDGIISALDREIRIDGKTMTLLQTSAAINPGNSGGGLYDAEGNLIGIVVAKSSSTTSGTSVEGLGFAIPINNIVDVLSDLKTKGYVSGRGYLGVSLIDITSQDAMFMYRVDKQGVYLSAVYDGTAADKAGLKMGGVIVKVDDTEVTSSSVLNSYILKHKAGDVVVLTIERDGKEMTVEATLGERENDNTAKNNTESSNNSGVNPYGGFGGYFN